MYEEKDYILRLIHEMIRMLAKLIFGKEIADNQATELSEEMSQLYQSMTAMVDNGDIDSAENILIENLDYEDTRYFYMSLLFYHYLNEKSERYLLEYDFSRAEILDGIKGIADFYGYEGFILDFPKDLTTEERSHHGCK